MESQWNMPALRSLFQLEEEACCHLVCWNSKSADAHLSTSLDNEHGSHREHSRPKDQLFFRMVRKGLLVVPVTEGKTFGDRAFAVARPRVWNSLPFSVRNNASIESFKRNLKTFC